MDQDRILTLALSVLAFLGGVGPHVYTWLTARAKNRVDVATAKEKDVAANSLVIKDLTAEIERLKVELADVRGKLAALEEVKTALQNERKDKAAVLAENITLRAELSATKTEIAHLREELDKERKLREGLQERVRQLEKKSTGPFPAAGASTP